MLTYLLSILVIMGIYMLLALALDLLYGFTGLINFGLAGFFGVGAYPSALLTMSWMDALALVSGGDAGRGGAGLAAGTRRLAAARRYLAIVTLGFSEIVCLVLVQEQWLTSGVQGIPGVPRLGAGQGNARFSDGLLLACSRCPSPPPWRCCAEITHSP